MEILQRNLAEVKITAPTGADVYINGVQVTDTYKIESEVKFAPCLHVSDYVTVPTNDVYDVGQLIAKPDITAKLNGKDLTVDYDKKTGYTIYYPSDDELYKKYGIKDIYNSGTVWSLYYQQGKSFLSFQAIWLVLQLSMSVIFLLYGRTSGVSHILISSTMNLLLISESIQTNVSHVMSIMTFMLITRQVIQHIKHRLHIHL